MLEDSDFIHERKGGQIFKMKKCIGGEYSYLLFNNPNCLLQRIILGYVILKINCP